MGLGYSSITTWDIFWNNFQIFLDVEITFLSPWVSDFPILYFLIYFPCYYWIYLSNQQLGE